MAQGSRRLGLGKQLVETAVERARARGCSLVTLDTNERNGPAISLYESLGFTCGGGPATDLSGGRQLWLTAQLQRSEAKVDMRCQPIGQVFNP